RPDRSAPPGISGPFLARPMLEPGAGMVVECVNLGLEASLSAGRLHLGREGLVRLGGVLAAPFLQPAREDFPRHAPRRCRYMAVASRANARHDLLLQLGGEAIAFHGDSAAIAVGWAESSQPTQIGSDGSVGF